MVMVAEIAANIAGEIAFDVAAAGIAHAAELVATHVTLSPLLSDDVVKIAEVSPVGLPLTTHE